MRFYHYVTIGGKPASRTLHQTEDGALAEAFLHADVSTAPAVLIHQASGVQALRLMLGYGDVEGESLDGSEALVLDDEQAQQMHYLLTSQSEDDEPGAQLLADYLGLGVVYATTAGDVLHFDAGDADQALAQLL